VVRVQADSARRRRPREHRRVDSVVRLPVKDLKADTVARRLKVDLAALRRTRSEAPPRGEGVPATVALRLVRVDTVLRLRVKDRKAVTVRRRVDTVALRRKVRDRAVTVGLRRKTSISR
jgi:hypothetical protein